MIYIKKELEPKLKFRDEEGRLIGVEAKINGEKTLIINLYAPNGPKEIFFLHT